MRILGYEITRRRRLGDVAPLPSFTDHARVSSLMGGRLYRDSLLTYDQIREMQRHPIVKFCLRFIKMPIGRVSINPQCNDEEIRKFLTEVMEPVIEDYLRAAASCLDFGYQCFEVMWERRLLAGRDAIVLSPFKPLRPEDCTIIEDDMGRFRGVEYTNADGTTVTLLDEEGKVLLVTNERQAGNRYGVSELEACKKSWSRQENIANMAMRYMEGKADPIPKIRYDSEGYYQSETGEPIDARSVAYDLGRNVRQGRPVVLPSRQTDKGNYAWEIDYLESSDRSPIFRSMLEYFDTMIMRSLLVPERALTQATETGSYSMAEAHGDFLIERQEDVIATLLKPLNESILPKLILYNFGRTENAMLVSGGLREQDKELTRAVANYLVSSPAITPEQKEWLEKRTGIPFTTADKITVQTTQMCDCDQHIALSARKYWRPLRAFENRVKLSALDGYLDGWLTETEMLLAGVLGEIKSRYMKKLEWALNNYSKQSQLMSHVRGLELMGGNAYRTTLYNQLVKLLDYCGRAACDELGVRYQGLTPDVIGWAKAQTDATWYKHDGDIRAAVNFAAIEAINKGKGTKEVLWEAEQVWQRWLEPGRDGKVGPLMQTATIYASQAVNRGRHVAKDTYDDTEEAETDPIIAVQRSEVLDKRVCRYCREILDEKIVDIRSPEYEEFFLVEPHYGCRGVNIFIRKSERFAADAMNDPKYKFRRPTKSQRENWVKETV